MTSSPTKSPTKSSFREPDLVILRKWKQRIVTTWQTHLRMLQERRIVCLMAEVKLNKLHNVIRNSCDAAYSRYDDGQKFRGMRPKLGVTVAGIEEKFEEIDRLMSTAGDITARKTEPDEAAIARVTGILQQLESDRLEDERREVRELNNNNRK